MLKFNQVMTIGVGNKSVSFTGRDKFRVKDEAFKKALLALGTVAEQEDGTLRYTGDVTFIDADGAEHKVDADGYLHVDAKALPPQARKDFI